MMGLWRGASRSCRGVLVSIFVLGGGTSVWAGAAAVAPPGKAASAPALPADARGLIRLIQDAAQRRSYTGIFVVNSGGSISSSRITHVADGRQQVERIEALDGQMRRVYRHNDVVHVLWPRSRDATIEQREVLPSFPASGLPDGQGALDVYELQLIGPDRVAGFDAEAVTLRPRDALRYAQRLWLERQSGLLLRTDTLGLRGEVIESAAFSELQFEGVPPAQVLLQEMRRLEGYRVQRPAVQRCDLEREGWLLRNLPAGFVQARCVRRPPPPNASARAPSGSTAGHATGTGLAFSGTTNVNGPAVSAEVNHANGPSGMLQATFSDGLTLVSVFAEPFDAAVHQRDSTGTWGATQAVSRRAGDWWITLVGDVPLATLQQFSAAMERRKP